MDGAFLVLQVAIHPEHHAPTPARTTRSIALAGSLLNSCNS
jgi:hypothetical protein